jgi:hypothetical protein
MMLATADLYLICMDSNRYDGIYDRQYKKYSAAPCSVDILRITRQSNNDPKKFQKR